MSKERYRNLWHLSGTTDTELSRHATHTKTKSFRPLTLTNKIPARDMSHWKVGKLGQI